MKSIKSLKDYRISLTTKCNGAIKMVLHFLHPNHQQAIANYNYYTIQLQNNENGSMLILTES